MVAEGEHFAARHTGKGDHKWLIIPDEDKGVGGWKNALGGKYLQVLPDLSPSGSFQWTGIPFETLFPEESLAAQLARFSAFCAEQPKNADFFEARARIHEKRKDYAAAVSDMTKVIELAPPKAEPFYERAKFQRQAKQYQEATADVERGFQLESKQGAKKGALAWRFNNEARRFVDLKDQCDAESIKTVLKWSQEAVKKAPRSSANLDTLGAAYYRAGEYHKAMETMRMSAEVGLGNVFTPNAAFTSMAYQKLGDQEKARKWLELSVAWQHWNKWKGFSANQKEAAELLKLDLDTLEVEVPKDDVAMYTRVLEVDPDAIWARFKRARTHEAENRKPLADSDYRQCAKLLEAFFDKETDKSAGHLCGPYNICGICYSRLGGHAKAVDYHTRSLELEPENRVLQSNLAIVLHRLARLLTLAEPAQRRDPKRAVVLADKAVDLQPDTQINWITLAEARYRAGELDEAEALLQMAQDLPTKDNLGLESLFARAQANQKEPDTDSLFMQALIAARRGQKQQARQLRQRAVNQMERIAPTGGLWLSLRIELDQLLGAECLVDLAQCYGRLAEDMVKRLTFADAHGVLKGALDHLAKAAVSEPARQTLQVEIAQLKMQLSGVMPITQKAEAARLEEAAIAELEALARASPGQHNVEAALALAHSKAGARAAAAADWPRAKTHLARAVALGAKEFGPYYELALVQLVNKDREGYQQTCRAMLERFKNTKEAVAARFTVWTCALAPDALADYAPALALCPNSTAAL